MYTYITLLLVGCVALSEATLRPRLDGRIVGGHKVDIKDFPYQLALLEYNSQICGASIISKNWALTAAHCINYPGVARVYSFRAGSTYHDMGGRTYTVAKVVVHPDYNPQTEDQDFALLQIHDNFDFNVAGIAKVSLTEKEPETNQACLVSGWGSLASNGEYPRDLRAVDVRIYNRNNCWIDYQQNGGISQNMICAKSPGHDSCQGDSGGPLVCNGVQVGVVSWGIGCADPRYPGVYSNIALARPWIKQTTGV